MNNIEIIKPLLYFENDTEFVECLILKRKKDCTTDKSNHQSIRTIKSYSFYSVEELENKIDEIITLCDLFKARAYININTKSNKSLALLMIKELVTCIEDNNNRLKYLYERCVGKLRSKQKRWIVDIDKEHLKYKHLIKTIIEGAKPYNINIDSKIICKIPTVSGIHLITYLFDRKYFNESLQLAGIKCDIQDNNPTILYIPESIK